MSVHCLIQKMLFIFYYVVCLISVCSRPVARQQLSLMLLKYQNLTSGNLATLYSEKKLKLLYYLRVDLVNVILTPQLIFSV